MSTTQFTVLYEGPSLQAQTMDVRDLGPALMSLGQLFDEANRVLNDGKAEVKLKIKATAPGSFQISFELVQSLLHQLTGLLHGEMVEDALTLKELVFGGISLMGGLLWLIRKLKGEKPNRIKDLGNGMLRLEIGQDAFDIPFEMLRLYQDLAVREALEKTVRPLEEDGIDSMQIKYGDEVVETIRKSETPYFKAPPFEQYVLLEDIRQIAYSIISLSFKEENKWRLFDGNSTVNAVISDENFLAKVEASSISFTKGDVLICEVKIIQLQTEGGLKTEYEVLKVIEHKPAQKQLSLLIEN